jgi:hypothetical protein
LEIDRVEAADDAVVGEGHLSCDVGGGVGCLHSVVEGVSFFLSFCMFFLLGRKGVDQGRTSREKARVDIRA